jgi:hypothetical protein
MTAPAGVSGAIIKGAVANAKPPTTAMAVSRREFKTVRIPSPSLKLLFPDEGYQTLIVATGLDKQAENPQSTREMSR